MRRAKLLLLLVALLSTATGCGIGLKSLLFVTRTQLAVDVDSEPPSMDVGFDREEFVLAPIFEGGQVLPVLTTVGTSTGLNFASDHSFATGKAALVMADAFNAPENYFALADDKKQTDIKAPKKTNGVITAPSDEEEIGDGFWLSIGRSIWGTPTRKRYFFGTDTSFGLHVEWSASNVPRSVNLGWKRKELAFVPLIERPVQTADPKRKDMVEIEVASLIATAAGATEIGSGPASTRALIGQTFATGDAATLLAAHGEIRQVLGPSLIKNYEEAVERKVIAQNSEQRALVRQIAAHHKRSNAEGKKIILEAADSAFPDTKIDSLNALASVTSLPDKATTIDRLKTLEKEAKEIADENPAAAASTTSATPPPATPTGPNPAGTPPATPPEAGAPSAGAPSATTPPAGTPSATAPPADTASETTPPAGTRDTD